MSDNELGNFLRVRRGEVTPAEVGLPPGNRRRTPGLRRAEVAMLAGVSVEYLIRLEQGRDRHPSPQVLAALAGPLRLAYETMELPGDDGLRLVVQLPADEATAEALRKISPLRLVAS